jgi:hypothetical protein
MSRTITLPNDQDETLERAAARSGVDADVLVLDSLRKTFAPETLEHIPSTDSEILSLLDRGLPAEFWQRYNELKLKRDDRQLTEAEHAEIIGMSDRVELFTARNLQLGIELAKRRGVEPMGMLRQLGLLHDSHA